MTAAGDQRWLLQPWTASAVIRAWERGDGGGRTLRALAVLSTLLPERSRQELLGLPLGRRDTLLLEARVQLLGDVIQGSVRCPSCNAEQAFALEVGSDLLSQAVPIDAPTTAELEHGESVYHLRVPTSADAMAIETLPPTAAMRELLRRCVAGAHEADELSDDTLQVIGDQLEALDPLALIPLAMPCGECGFEWQPVLEVAEIVWAELDNLARRLLDEAQTLAGAYGWSEEQIFAMSGHRRRYYLENVPSAGGDDETPRPLPQTPWAG